ncbi:DUF748 domain-containing protein [Sulfurimonas sp.]|nr:DUF748 domain-containing protein [Sulfurimonas sp.]
MLKKILSVLIIYSVIGFVILPIVLKSQVVEITNKEINAKLSIEDIDFNPFIFRLIIHGLDLKDLSGQHLISFKSFEIDIDPYNLYNGTINVKKVLLSSPQILLEQNKDKVFNLATILKESDEVVKPTEEETPSKLPRIIIDELAVEEGIFTYTDNTKLNKFHTSIKDITFILKDIDTDDFTSRGAELRFYSNLGNGGKIDIKTNILGLEPLNLEGSIDFKLNKLYNHERYVQDELGIEVANGKFSLYADYRVNTNDLNATSIDNLEIDLADLRLKPKNKNIDILNLQSFKVQNASIKPFQKDIHVDGISLKNLLVDFSIDEDGNIDLLDYINNVKSNQNKRLNSYKYSLIVGSMNTHLDLNISSSSEENATNYVNVNNVDFELNNFLFTSQTDNEKLLGFKNFKIDDINVDTKTKDLHVSAIDLNGLGIYLRKDKTGDMNINKLMVSKESKESKSSVESQKDASEEKPFSVKLGKVSLSSAEINFNDESIQDKTISRLDNIDINAYNIDSSKNSWLDYDATIRVNRGGTVNSKGTVRHTPLQQKGTFTIDRVSLKEITPYLQESMHLALVDGFFSLNSNLSYSKSSKQPDLHVTGGLKLEEFELMDSRNSDRLLTFSKTELKSFTLDLFPGSLFIDKINLDAFYVNAQIDKNKQMNLAQLSKTTSDEKKTKESDNNSTIDKGEPFPLKIMQLHVSNGAAIFADYSLPLQFKTSIHDLNGDVYAISNTKGEVSYIDIDGEIDKYGSTKIKGSIEASDIKSYTDIGVSFRNLGLDSYSGYSAQFAGHKIESGKLFLDLGYKIHNSELLGSNSVVIKKMELGDTIEDENITALPLGFAIALLEDSEGVIDIDMPVEGNMDEPDFKYGSLVLKTFANLIVKAVTSPFNFLGAAMGIDGDELKFVDFEPSEYIILPPQREKLDNLAKILVKKQKLSLDILSSYDAELDKKAIQLNKLTDEVIKRSDEAILTVDILEDIYEESVGSDISDALKDEFEKRYEDDDDLFDSEYRKELLVRCTSTQIVSLEELQELAQGRANGIRTYLVVDKQIDPSRIIAKDVLVSEENDEKWAKTELKIVVK